jgi:hypothetical protein|tara:strand:+ start:2632 stop:2847 length:216 start_codon:yes stop_codon:yes gene_type:complete
MLKFFLIGWACVSSSGQEQCIRVGSEVIHDTFESCQQHYGLILSEISKVEDVNMQLNCVSSGVIEDLMLGL